MDWNKYICDIIGHVIAWVVTASMITGFLWAAWGLHDDWRVNAFVVLVFIGGAQTIGELGWRIIAPPMWHYIIKKVIR